MTLGTDIFEQLTHQYIFWLDEKWTYVFSNLHPYFGMITVTLSFLLYFNQNDQKFLIASGSFLVGAFITGYSSLIQNQGAIPFQAYETLDKHRLYASLLVTLFILGVAIKFISKAHKKLIKLENVNNFLYVAITFLAFLLMTTGKDMVFKYAIGVITG